ncbi:MAG: GNAT family N-acetyltransferase [Lentisphaeria bacterium]|nr:GNAT family N-acetyltransferase [Lentisphaeria bacterium]
MADSVVVRDALVADVTTIACFNACLARETEDRQLDGGILVRGVQAVVEDSRLAFYLVAEVDGAVAGCLMVTSEWSDWRNGVFWWLQSVYVAPECRRRGVFRALIEAVRIRAAAAAEHVCGLRLYVETHNILARATYRRFGFEETGYMVLEALPPPSAAEPDA